ncbi:MAG: hypothetical protein EPN47_03915 [Acidobacteria bacterium]|nr:MAG: hypothetical protein EPN47_03915 [Acidobacteriota bacterium]
MRSIFYVFVLLNTFFSTGLTQSPESLSPFTRQYVLDASVDAPVTALTHVPVIDGKGAPPRGVLKNNSIVYGDIHYYQQDSKSRCY